jgi:hypothetical protein
VTRVIDPFTHFCLRTPCLIQSNTLVSRILAMVAEDRSTRVVLDELLGATVSNGVCVRAVVIYLSSLYMYT